MYKIIYLLYKYFESAILLFHNVSSEESFILNVIKLNDFVKDDKI